MSFIQPEFKNIFDKVQQLTRKKKITSENVFYFVGIVMEIMEKENTLTGRQKKQLTIDSLKEIVRVTNTIPEERKEAVYNAIDMTAPAAIDFIISSSKREMNLNLISGCFKTPKETMNALDLMNKKIKKRK